MLNSIKIAEFLNETTDRLENREFPTESIVISLRNKLIDIAKECFDAKQVFSKTKPKIHNDKRWFDNDCLTQKQKLNKYQKCTRKV